MTLSLAEELLLLAFDDESGKQTVSGDYLDAGLGGAQLLELALAERVDVLDDRVVVANPTPLNDPVLDQALSRIGGEQKLRKPQWWVTRLGKDLRDLLLDRLVERGLLRREEGNVLWVFSRDRFPAASSTAESDARSRLHAAVALGQPPEPRTAALASLVRATRMDGKVFPDVDRRTRKQRLEEISRGNWAGDAVKRAVDAIDSAMMAAVVAASTGATAASAASS
jgi:Golgi phosphoprotein 3 (GPP34)